MTLAELKSKRKIFFLLFVVSTITFIASNGIVSAPNTSVVAPDKTISETVSVVSLIVSVTGILGFFSTTILAWRKEKRDGKLHEMILEEKKLEIEALRKNINSE